MAKRKGGKKYGATLERLGSPTAPRQPRRETPSLYYIDSAIAAHPRNTETTYTWRNQRGDVVYQGPDNHAEISGENVGDILTCTVTIDSLTAVAPAPTPPRRPLPTIVLNDALTAWRRGRIMERIEEQTERPEPRGPVFSLDVEVQNFARAVSSAAVTAQDAASSIQSMARHLHDFQREGLAGMTSSQVQHDMRHTEAFPELREYTQDSMSYHVRPSESGAVANTEAIRYIPLSTLAGSFLGYPNAGRQDMYLSGRSLSMYLDDPSHALPELRRGTEEDRDNWINALRSDALWIVCHGGNTPVQQDRFPLYQCYYGEGSGLTGLRQTPNQVSALDWRTIGQRFSRVHTRLVYLLRNLTVHSETARWHIQRNWVHFYYYALPLDMRSDFLNMQSLFRESLSRLGPPEPTIEPVPEPELPVVVTRPWRTVFGRRVELRRQGGATVLVQREDDKS